MNAGPPPFESLDGNRSVFGRIALSLIVIGSLIGTFVSFDRAGAAQDLSASESLIADELSLVEIRTRAEILLFDEFRERVLVDLGVGDDERTAAAQETRTREIALLIQTLDTMASDAPKSIADQASALRSSYLDAGVDERSPDFESLVLAAEESRFAYRIEATSPIVSTLEALTTAGMLPRLVVHDAVVAFQLRSDTVTPSVLEELFLGSDLYMRDRSDVLGPDDDRPVSGSIIAEDFDIAAAINRYPAEVDTIDDILASTPLVEIDRWMAAWTPEIADDAPVALGEVVGSAIASSDPIDELILVTVEAEIADRIAASSDAESISQRWTTSGVILATSSVMLLAVVATLVVNAVRSARRRAELASVDRLTGVGNRYALESRTTPMTARSSWHHIVVIIDLDRFKLVNDTWGHAAGDRVLVEIAQRLERLGTDLASASSGDSTVVRLGGDEFLFSHHSPTPIDVDAVWSALDEIRRIDVEVDEGLTVELSFSLGMATADGGAVLGDLMSEADLRAYEDKSHRHAATPTRSSDAPA